MKTVNDGIPARKCTSDQPLIKTNTLHKGSLQTRNSIRDKEPAYFHLNFSIKSETSINKNLIALKDSPAEESESQLIPTPETPKHPKEVLRKSLIKLKSNQRSEYVFALRDVIQISRFHPQLLIKSMPIIYKGMTTLLRSLRPAAARTACQAANELFMNTPSVEGPELEELVHVLLQKTSDGNKCLRKDALEALDSMIIHVPPSLSIKILLHRRIAGYNPSVRATATKLLACILNISGEDPDITEDVKIKLVMAGMRFLQDDSKDIKFHGIRLVTMLMQSKAYENIIREKISVSLIDRINEIMDNLKTSLGP